MIMPTKYLREDEALIGAGATLLQRISRPKTLSDLWEETKSIPSLSNFERFILALDLLYLLNLIDFCDNEIVRVKL